MPLPNVRSNYLGLESVGQLYRLKKEGSIPSTVFFSGVHTSIKTSSLGIV